MSPRPLRIGILGAGHLGIGLYGRLAAGAEPGLVPAFVWARRAEALAPVAPAHRLADIAGAAAFAPDLVVEAAHPDLTRAHGEGLLAVADYMPLSVTALADEGLGERLAAAAERHGRRLLLPAGALDAAQALAARRRDWARVTITFRKHPASIDFADAGLDPATLAGPTVLYDGPVRGIARLYPRNVNTMVTCALASVGLDRCRGRLIADRALTVGIAEVEAEGLDGAVLRTEKRQPMAGVSGTEMLAALLRSLRLATGLRGPVEIV